MNPDFETIGKAFVTQYYAAFDKKATRENVGELYNPVHGMRSFEGVGSMGGPAIKEQIKNSPLDDIQRVCSTIDVQPMMDGGIIINVLGQLKNNSEGDKVMPFCETFILKAENGSYFISHDIFRLCLHNISG